MGEVIAVISMSLDGYITGPEPTLENPVGTGGDRLVDWAFGDDPRDRAILENGVAGLGAVVAGRRTYDGSIPWWGSDGPTGPARKPVFVVSHDKPESLPPGGVYTFVNGVEAAVAQARSVAGEGVVSVMGGASLIQQALSLKLVDQIQIHLAPVLLGGGLRLFERLGLEPLELTPVEVRQGGRAIHLRFAIENR